MTTPDLSLTKATPVLAVLGAAAVAMAARRFRALSRGGALAATAVGGAVVAGTGLRGGAALVTFFVSSTLLGRIPHASGRRQRRGNERDAVQVLANGGVAAALALALTGRRRPGRPRLLAAFGGALAAATADTWATEIGSRLSQRPRSIVTGRPVPAGTSGAVSWAGFLASTAGAASIAGMTGTGQAQLRMAGQKQWQAVLFGGLCGALVDSVLGATVQEVRFCHACREETELPRHRCGTPTTVVRGVARFDNDVVNVVATLAGAATAAALTGGSRAAPTTPDPRSSSGVACAAVGDLPGSWQGPAHRR